VCCVKPEKTTTLLDQRLLESMMQNRTDLNGKSCRIIIKMLMRMIPHGPCKHGDEAMLDKAESLVKEAIDQTDRSTHVGFLTTT